MARIKVFDKTTQTWVYADKSFGKDGTDGKDGVSPTVAVNKSGKVTTISITDKNGTKNATINDGTDGSPGSNGKDGTSVTVKSVSESTADGGSNVVTFSDGKTLTIKNGSKGSTGATGATGQAGADGKTPVKGTDYWTAVDKAAMVQDVIDALGGVPVFGTVDTNNVIILSGNLAEGTYTLKYEDADGNVTEIGTLNHSNAPEATYTNLFDPNTASLNTRMSGSSKAPKNENGYVMTASIPITATQVTSSAVSAFIAVPKSMWSGSANMFLGMGEYTTQGMCGPDATIDVVVGDFVKIPLRNQWGNSFTCDSIILSLYVKGSAIAASDIQNIEIYSNEIPE